MSQIDSENPAARIFVISGPSGVGKSSIEQALVDADPNLHRSVSHTTRSKRTSETDGVDYFFVSQEEFHAKVESGDFVESAEIFGNQYGTSKQAIESTVSKGRDVLLIIDWQGAQNLRKSLPTVSIFLLPPSLEELRMRLESRQQDSPSVIEHRINQAVQDMRHWTEYDRVIVNDEFNQAVDDIQTLIQATRQGQEVSLGASKSQIESILTTQHPLNE